MKKCKSCKSEIDSKATKCPHCQSDQRGWFKRHPILTGIAVIFIILLIIGASSGKDANQSTNTNTGVKSDQQSEAKAPPTPEKINVRDLADDFDGNAVAAKDKWKDKLVQFSAQISNITDTGISFSNIATKQFSFTQVSCRVKDKSQLLPLKNGQTVTVQGIVGGQTIGVIDLSSCEVVQ